MDDDLSFEYGEETDAYCGCGATLMGEMWYFGGRYNKRQVSFIILFSFFLILWFVSYCSLKIKDFACERDFFKRIEIIFFIHFRAVRCFICLIAEFKWLENVLNVWILAFTNLSHKQHFCLWTLPVIWHNLDVIYISGA